MNPERTQETAPERIYLGYTSFWYETSEEGIHDIEYVRADLLIAARKEEREAAFKVLCPDCAGGDEPTFDKQARWYYHGSGNQEVGCSSSKLRIAALEAHCYREGRTMTDNNSPTKTSKGDCDER